MADERPEPVTILCSECGVLVEIHDPAAVLLAMHLANDCDISNLIVHREA